MGTLRFFEEVVSFKIRRTFGFADYRNGAKCCTEAQLFCACNAAKSFELAMASALSVRL